MNLGQENYNSAQLYVVRADRIACHFIELSVGLIKLSIELWPVRMLSEGRGDPGFLERGFVVHFADFISIFLNIP